MSLDQYHVTEVFSNFSGTRQCIQLSAPGLAPGMAPGSWAGLTITVTDGTQVHLFTFPSGLPSVAQPIFPVLLGTSKFGFPFPDYVIPDGFLFAGGGTITIEGGDVFTYGPLPLDGRYALYRSGGLGELEVFNYQSASGPGVPLPLYLVAGTEGDDHIVAPGGSSNFRGYAGNDILEINGGLGTVRIEGGEGRDTARVHKHGADIINTFVVGVELHLVFAGEGSLTLVPDVERLRLDDIVVAFDTHPGESTWRAGALLWAGFGHSPGIGELSEWTAVADHSASMGALAQQMLDHYAPGMDSVSLAQHLYHSVLGRDALQSELDGIPGIVGPGKLFATNGDMLAWLASQEANTARMDAFTAHYALLDPAFF